MQITFYSNFLNHHQLPFCERMYAMLGSNFTFVATERVPQEQLSLGYKDLNECYPFVLQTYNDGSGVVRAQEIADKSDIVIMGSAPFEFVKKRIEANKLTFIYSERLLKRGLWRILSPRALYNWYNMYTKYNKKNFYLLAAGAYASGDFSLLGAFQSKMFKWGYFPDVKKCSIDELLAIKTTEPISILWCGRFLSWKHPEKAIAIAMFLRTQGYEFILNMIGEGEMAPHIRNLIISNNLSKYVHLLGSMPTANVREYMEKASIFLFTSDYNEGWGAVLNEAMNSGCAVIASHAIGSVSFLLQHGVNGMVYKNGDDNELFRETEELLQNEALRTELGKNAYATIITTWNAEVAATRFIELSECILNKTKCCFHEGPCSPVLPVAQCKMYRRLVDGKME